ncbi:ChbG/HpnK family deacetylase [Deltaproteobacteria bacterium IMCC39524]|nr:ChbG/HpnK family deacetylase [Deltaproteobacteria bacterium IMCC39524]
MISLIINADDLGCNALRDRGILEAQQKGIVTSASILANGSSFNTAIKQVKHSKLPVGVHLNLADGRALTGPIKGLTDSSGNLPGKKELRRQLTANCFDPEEIRKELKAQVQRILEAGVQPDHLDGHQHCQLFPCLTTMVTELAREYGIPAMRSALPADISLKDPSDPLGKELALYCQLGHKAKEIIMTAGLLAPDGLMGMPLLNQLDQTRLYHVLENIPEGFWELMVHPGYSCDSGNPFDGPQREVELLALLSPEAKQIIARRHIRLCHFGDLSCAS